MLKVVQCTSEAVTLSDIDVSVFLVSQRVWCACGLALLYSTIRYVQRKLLTMKEL